MVAACGLPPTPDEGQRFSLRCHNKGGTRMTPADEATVFIIDDDTRMRAATERLLRSAGLHTESFAAPQDFLGHKLPLGPSCLVLDVRLPGISGLDVQRKLNEMGIYIPIIF